MSTFVNDGRVWRRILVAATVSGALHAGVLALAGRHWAPAPEDLPPLEVRVVRVAPKAVPPAAQVAPPARSARLTPKARPAESAASRTDVVTVADVPEEIAEPEITVPVESEVAAIEEPVVVATAPASTFSPEPAALPTFPRSGRITYDLLYGDHRFPVGRTVQSWRIDDTRYQLASRSETTGIVDLFRSQHRTYLSRGELTPHGLRPDVFLMSRDRGGVRGIEEARAQFHWERGAITLGNATTLHEEGLPPGSHDIVSFIYQLSVDPPPPGRRHVSITNGRRLESYVVDVLPEENIETPLGVLRTVPVTQVRKPGAESVDVWLAVEYRHLPVRMRFYDRHGEPAGEQIVTEIRLGEE